MSENKDDWLSRVMGHLETAHGTAWGTAGDLIEADTNEKKWRAFMALKISGFTMELTKYYVDYRGGLEAPDNIIDE